MAYNQIRDSCRFHLEKKPARPYAYASPVLAGQASSVVPWEAVNRLNASEALRRALPPGFPADARQVQGDTGASPSGRASPGPGAAGGDLHIPVI